MNGADSGLSQPLLQFVLGHAQVTTHFFSRQEWESGYAMAWRTLSDYNYIFVRRGHVVWTVEDEDCPLGPGDLAVIPPGKWHGARGCGDPLLLGSLHVDVTMPGGTDVFQLLLPRLVRSVEPGSRLDGYLEGAMAEWERADDRMTAAMLPSWARLISLELLRHDAERGLLQQRPIDPLVGTLLDELNADPVRRRTLDDLAAWSGFSAQHLNRRFRRLVGMTPLQYAERLRMERAARMLATGRQTVRAVAHGLGFDDPYYFSRVFTRHYGRSPSQWRDESGSGRT